MAPALQNRAVWVEQAIQQSRLIDAQAAPQHEILGALNHADRINLHPARPLDGRPQLRHPGRRRRGVQQTLRRQHHTARLVEGQLGGLMPAHGSSSRPLERMSNLAAVA